MFKKNLTIHFNLGNVIVNDTLDDYAGQRH